MKILDHVQGTAEWLAARAGIPTASELDNLISPTGELRAGDMPKSYLALKLAERWTGGPIQSFSGGAMEQGTLLEPEAIPYFELLHNVEIRRIGLATTDDGTFGCSPDGLSDGYGWELKCPQPHNHCAWLIENRVPKKHLMQCHGGMFVTGLPEWRFASYCRNFPPLVVTVKRDEMLMRIMRERLAAFTATLELEFAKLVQLNGGLPKRLTPSTPEQLADHPFI